jgi:hypothetical protein
MSLFRCQIDKELRSTDERYHFASNVLMVTDGRSDLRVPGLEKLELCRECAEKFAKAMCDAIGMKFEVDVNIKKLQLLAQR